MKLLICMLPVMALAMADGDKALDGQELTAANNQFSAKMFNEVTKLEGSKSVVMSGFSALSPLAQLGLASVGASHDEILRTIGMPNDEATKAAFLTLNTNLRSVKGVELKVANRVYIPVGRELNETFAKMSREVFNSDVKNVDFTKNKEAADTINAWVEENTNNKIKDLVDPNSLDSDTRAVLVNAIYFKGLWASKFNKDFTTDRDFHVSTTKTIKVPTMFKSGDFKYGESKILDAKLLELPYEGEEASLLIILPNQIDGIEALKQKLQDTTALTRAVDEMSEREVDVYLPKFKIETTIDLKKVLQNVGVTKLFSSNEAKLDYILKGESDLYASDAIQKAFIEVNEEGTEAAAASEFGIAFLSAALPEFNPIQFSVDHPFIFYMKEKENPLFLGAVYF